MSNYVIVCVFVSSPNPPCILKRWWMEISGYGLYLHSAPSPGFWEVRNGNFLSDDDDDNDDDDDDDYENDNKYDHKEDQKANNRVNQNAYFSLFLFKRVLVQLFSHLKRLSCLPYAVNFLR